jgi:hypothetical protein
LFAPIIRPRRKKEENVGLQPLMLLLLMIESRPISQWSEGGNKLLCHAANKVRATTATLTKEEGASNVIRQRTDECGTRVKLLPFLLSSPTRRRRHRAIKSYNEAATTRVVDDDKLDQRGR